MNQIEEHNQFFIDYFMSRLKFVEEHCLDRIEGRILLCSYIDSLGGYHWPKLGNRARFERLILEYSTDKHIWSRISLPKYAKHLRSQDPDKLKYFERLFRRLGVINHEYLKKGHNPDCTIEELQKYAQGIILTPFSDELKLAISKYKYIDVLWNEYRNLAIHETRTPNDEAPGILWGDMNIPFYERMHNGFDDLEGAPRFKIPQSFILKTLKDCIVGFKAYLNEKNIDILEPTSGKQN